MCGICGIIEPSTDNESLINKMLDVIAHRGPDGKATFKHNKVILGHRRLAIIDLKTGDQPIFNEDKTICVIFNGEIYNYLDFKTELEKKGHKFYTKTDTEVIVHLYEEYDCSFFEHLNGIFAFAIYDANKEKLILVRDHFGVKPLHYYYADNLFVFGSEQKSILLHPRVPCRLNYKALHSQLNLRYSQMNETLFDEIKRLPPAHYLVWQKNKIEIKRYWELNPLINYNLSEVEVIEQIHFYIKQAVNRQLISDVPIGVYLSGGMDSSTIVQKMFELGVAPINTFTLGFNEPTDEFEDAQKIANHFNTVHHTTSLDFNPLKNFPEVIWHAEEPKINLLQGYNMSKFVRKYVTVVLSGLGGDELFAGYDIHRFIAPFNYLHKITPEFIKKILTWKAEFIYRIQHFLNRMSFDEYFRGLQLLFSIGNIERFYLILRNAWDYDEHLYREIYHPEFYNYMLSSNKKIVDEFNDFFQKVKHLSPLEQVLFTEFNTKMVNDYLLTEDRMSMANSVEQRVPFLDIDLVKFGFSIPIKLKIKYNKTKYIFRKAMLQKLPPEIINKKKWGFTANPYLQFKKDLKQVASEILNEDFVNKQKIFNYKYIKKIIDHPPTPRLKWHYSLLWIMLGIAYWQKIFVDKEITFHNN